MKFETIRFVHPVTVFGNSSVGLLSVVHNEHSRTVDSIVPAGHWVIVTKDGHSKAVPASAVESADVIAEEPRPSGIGVAYQQAHELAALGALAAQQSLNQAAAHNGKKAK